MDEGDGMARRGVVEQLVVGRTRLALKKPLVIVSNRIAADYYMRFRYYGCWEHNSGCV